MRTLGVDLAANPDKTVACLIDWSSLRVDFLPRPTGDDVIVAAAGDVHLVALDVPLGWPDAFVAAVTVHHQLHEWPAPGGPDHEDREELRFRRTDRALRARGIRPLSVSSDLIGVTAMRGALLQRRLRAAGIEVDRSGTAGRVIEAYPAAALRSWGLPSQGYKGSAGRAARAALIEALVATCGSAGDAVTTNVAAALSGADDDELDAFVCAVVARAAALGATAGPGESDLEAARREGWIHVPTVALAEIMALPA